MSLNRVYKRCVRVFFGGLVFQNEDDDGPRISFDVFRAMRGSEPSSASIRVWNLGQLEQAAVFGAWDGVDAARKSILNNPALTDQARGALLRANEETIASVTIEAGYLGGTGVIFRGSVTSVSTVRDSNGVDVVTTIEAGDGAIALRDGYISQFFDATSQENIRKVMTVAQGLADDPENTVTIGAAFPGAAATKLANGKVYAQPFTEMMDEIMELYGLQWYIDGGMVKVLNPGQSVPLPAVVLQEGNEIAATLQQTEYKDVQARCFLFANLVPGRAVRFLDRLGLPLSARGHRVEAVTFTGDTHGANWFADIDTRQLIGAFGTNVTALAASEAEVAARAIAAGNSTENAIALANAEQGAF